MELIYGTGNPAKLIFMKRACAELAFDILSLTEASEKYAAELPEIEETGRDPLENARIKAGIYFELFQRPVFSCDSGLYLWNHETGEMLPEELQPGIHVRGRGKVRLTDEELLSHFTGLVKEYGPVTARYKNAICLILNREQIFESMEEDLWGEPFLLTDKPHPKKVPGFPLDSISVHMATGQYYYDMGDNSQDDVAATEGFKKFFKNCQIA